MALVVDSTKGFPSVRRSGVSSLSVVILFISQGVCGQRSSATYQHDRVCAFVGFSVSMSCSYTNHMACKQAYWTKSGIGDPPDLTDNPNYRGRTRVDCCKEVKQNYICDLHIDSVTKTDAGIYYCGDMKKNIGKSGVNLKVIETPQTQTSLTISPRGDILDGTDVTLTCNKNSDQPVQSYSWYKHNFSTHLYTSTGNTYTIKNISLEDSGKYQCCSHYKCGYQYSETVYLQVFSGHLSPLLTAVISVCAVLRLLSVVLSLSKKIKKESMTWAGHKQNTRDDLIHLDQVYQGQTPITFQADVVHQSLNPNTTQPDSIYQSLNPNTTQPDSIYQSPNPKTTQPDAVYQSQTLNTAHPDAIYQSLTPSATQSDTLYLNPKAIHPNVDYQWLEQDTIQPDPDHPDPVYQTINKKIKKESMTRTGHEQNTRDGLTHFDQVYQSLNPNTTQPDSIYQSLNPNTTQPDAVYQSLTPNTTQSDTLYQNLNPKAIQPNVDYQRLEQDTIQPDPDHPDPVYQTIK
ncbi:uncharacterized protein LOC134068153 [Sardina pilchardus]|uniref:uncharacterized protein LOC134068153 n=1 Tax=Sardina pilchardus TaxID=27697 RepID=UPI002E117C3D